MKVLLSNQASTHLLLYIIVWHQWHLAQSIHLSNLMWVLHSNRCNLLHLRDLSFSCVIHIGIDLLSSTYKLQPICCFTRVNYLLSGVGLLSTCLNNLSSTLLRLGVLCSFGLRLPSHHGLSTMIHLGVISFSGLSIGCLSHSLRRGRMLWDRVLVIL